MTRYYDARLLEKGLEDGIPILVVEDDNGVFEALVRPEHEDLRTYDRVELQAQIVRLNADTPIRKGDFAKVTFLNVRRVP